MVIPKREFLVIVESPSKINKIESYLGNDYRVIASCGHICTLAKLSDIDIQNHFECKYRPMDTKKDHIIYMRETIEQYPKTHVILAMDNDREGEAIAFHICRMFHLPIETTKRILFNEITQEALQTAILPSNQTILNLPLVRTQQARQIIDLLIGFKISPLLWKYVYYSKTCALSAGRCQSPALCLLYDHAQERKREIEPRTMPKYYRTTADFFPHPFTLVGELQYEFTEKEKAQSFLEESRTFTHTFVLDEKKVSHRSSPKPFHTSSLLQSAHSVLHLSPQITNQLAQTLYQTGHITYLRTESKKYSQAFLVQAEQCIIESYGRPYVGNLPKLSNAEEKTPHEAIRVTDLRVTQIDSDDSRLKSLYKLIWKNTWESCMSDAQFHVYKLTIQAPQKKVYHTSIDVPVFLGWTTMNQKGKEEIATDKTLFYVQSLTKKEATLQRNQSIMKQKGGKPHYTESGLIQQLEERGIGRPSTYAMFVHTLLDKGYAKCMDVEGTDECCTDFQWERGNTELTMVDNIKTFGAEKNKLVIQPSGILVVEFLHKHFASFFDYDYTQRMEEALDHVEVDSWYHICETTYQDLQTLMQPIALLESKKCFPLDEHHVVLFQDKGPVVRKTVSTFGENSEVEEPTYEYLPIRKQLDMDRLAKGGYTVDDLVEFPSSYLGKYQEHNVYIKYGPYGPYVEWTKDKTIQRKSIKEAEVGITHLREFTLEHAIQLLEENQETKTKTQENQLRILSSSMSVRKGAYGPYIYYQTCSMKNPRFVGLKGFPNDFMTCDIDDFTDWIKKTSTVRRFPCKGKGSQGKP